MLSRLQDAESVETHLIYGFRLTVADPPAGLAGTLFSLEHHNQIQTDRKAILVEFRVENGKAAAKWEDVLRNMLEG